MHHRTFDEVPDRGLPLRAGPPQPHCPYPTWTHREGGRQVTKSLTADQADRLRPFLAKDRRLHELVRELEAISVELVGKTERIALRRQTEPGNRKAKAGQ